ncbi:Phosphopantetheine adenylyltransferase [Rubellimicrobium thermophilum DSM 16684]|uniref:Phosphopantetheine adenylyltransferase n=1 Tax=Rubellimicrobium thermophilum DSM 16684 TaxID=1123069 RepID=S9R330_9RHOB|nr:pantetheine-phosphate adenylyltransferase [Rubellimicrobium thermophilum]EPX86317.1 Phosphopantetheine adenylyltransferase [Rubellimicrobium thermophilum DSM 16684]
MRIGLYPGTFDPIHFGHTDIIRRACRLVDRLVVGVAINRDKGPLFTLEERVALIEAEVAPLASKACEIVVYPFEGLLIDCAREVGAGAIFRGLRAVADFEYEFQMVGMNRMLDDSIETVFLMAEARHQAIASRLVKEIARLGGDVSRFVPPAVAAALHDRLGPAAARRVRGMAAPAAPAAAQP